MPDEIITDLTQIQRATVAKEDENAEFRTFVKLEVELSDRRLNALVSETTSEVWKHIDCRSCANCCRTRQPVFSRAEAERIAAYLGISMEELRARYITSDAETGKSRLRVLADELGMGDRTTIQEVVD
jgi:hypothetical protein